MCLAKIRIMKRLVQLPFFFLTILLLNLNASSQVNYSNNNIEENEKSDSKDICIPIYSKGCYDGDGLTSFSFAEIQNINSGCENNTGYFGWSQYFDMGPAVVYSGTYIPTELSAGYSNTYLTIWIDYDKDSIFSENEIILDSYLMEEPNLLYDVLIHLQQFSLPGLHIMRARTNYNYPCTDPCNYYEYGEAEDYYVWNASTPFGILNGYVTNCLTGEAVVGAKLKILDFVSTTSGDGNFSFDVLPVGNWEIIISAEGYCSIDGGYSFTILDGETTFADTICLEPGQIMLSTDTINIYLDEDNSISDSFQIVNSSACEIEWESLMDCSTDDFLDIQFQFPIDYTSYGIETDGDYFYTASSNYIRKFGLDGTYIGNVMSYSASISKMTFDGNLFYCSNGSPTIQVLDIINGSSAGTLSAPVWVYAIAYDHNNDWLIGNHHSSDITIFDKLGNIINSFPVGLERSYKGFAYDDITPGGPYLWGLSNQGNENSILVQIYLETGLETGFSINMNQYLNSNPNEWAGDLFCHPNVVPGYWTLGGIASDPLIWGLELDPCQIPWLNFGSSTGTIPSAGNQNLMMSFSSQNLEPGIYETDVFIKTIPKTESSPVHINLCVNNYASPINLEGNFDCTDFFLSWEMPSTFYPNYYKVFKDGQLIETTETNQFCDTLLFPGENHYYSITAIYDSNESEPSNELWILVPIPNSLEALNVTCLNNSDYNEIEWNEPVGCLENEGYYIYRDGSLLDSITVPNTIYIDNEGSLLNEYSITAKYYFGESEHYWTYCFFNAIQYNDAYSIDIYPNPIQSWFVIRSAENLKHLDIYDNLGVQIREIDLSGTTQLIEMQEYQAGLYLIRIETKNRTIIRKIIVK